MSTRIAIVLAILLGAVAAVAVRGWMEEQKQKTQEKYDPVRIVVARRSLKKGETLDMRDMQSQFITKPFVVAGMIPVGEASLHRGKLLERPVQKGEPILTSFLETARTEYKAQQSMIKPGWRAMTLRVDQIAGVAGLIRPGDYVDIVGTFDQAAAEGAPGRAGAVAARSSKTIYLLQAVRILAVDDRTMDVATRRGGGGTYRSVTVEVRPWDALRLISAQSQGKLQLMLRARSDVETTQGIEGSRPTVSWDILSEVGKTTDYAKVQREEPAEQP